MPVALVLFWPNQLDKELGLERLKLDDKDDLAEFLFLPLLLLLLLPVMTPMTLMVTLMMMTMAIAMKPCTFMEKKTFFSSSLLVSFARARSCLLVSSLFVAMANQLGLPD